MAYLTTFTATLDESPLRPDFLCCSIEIAVNMIVTYLHVHLCVEPPCATVLC
jgi:hypothetical protein